MTGLPVPSELRDDLNRLWLWANNPGSPPDAPDEVLDAIDTAIKIARRKLLVDALQRRLGADCPECRGLPISVLLAGEMGPCPSCGGQAELERVAARERDKEARDG